MVTREILVFSPCGEFFVCTNNTGNLTIWETASNNIKQEFNINSHLNTQCSSLMWGSFQNTIIKDINEKEDSQLLIIGTYIGGIHLYDYSNGKLFNHFNSVHSDAVNDFSLDLEGNRLFSCSSDKSVVICDLISGKTIKKWQAGDEELHSICLVDNNNLLIANTSVLWWDIKEQCIIKEFECYENPITHLRAIKSMDKSVTTYFLAAASGETKISAWALSEKNNKKGAVASFVLPEETRNIDVNSCFSKSNPLLLTAVTQSGALVLYQHVLNGKTKKLTPQMTLQVISKGAKSSSIPVISSKILDCAESCIIAYGSSKNPVFESVNIYDCPKTLTLARENPLLQKLHNKGDTTIKMCKDLNESVINGQAPDDLCSTPKRRKHKDKDIEIIYSSSDEQNRSCNTKADPVNNRISEESPQSNKKRIKPPNKLLESPCITDEKQLDELHTDPLEMVNSLVKGIEEDRTSLINSVLQCDDSELIRSSIRNFPLHSLNLLLLELHKRYSLEKRYNSSSIRNWLKETYAIHLSHIETSPELTDILNKIRPFVDARRDDNYLSRMHMLKGLLKIQQMQNCSSSEEKVSSSESDRSPSDSEVEDEMLMES